MTVSSKGRSRQYVIKANKKRDVHSYSCNVDSGIEGDVTEREGGGIDEHHILSTKERTSAMYFFFL